MLQVEHDPVARQISRFASGRACFDIGANVGLLTETMLDAGGEVVAVEADPTTFALLQKRVGDRARCVNALVGAGGGERRTWLSNTVDNKCSTSVVPGDEPAGHTYLKPKPMWSVSLDTLAKLYGYPDLIKTDCEGSDMAVLDGGKKVLARRPIVIMEFSALPLMNFGRVNPRDVLDRLLGMFPLVASINGEVVEPITDPYAWLSNHVLQRGCVDNLLCTWG